MTATITAEITITIENAGKLPNGEGVKEFERQLEELINLPGLLESEAKITRMVLI